MADLSVNIGELQMNNPVMTASGTFGYGEEFADFIDITRIGGIIVRVRLFTNVKVTHIAYGGNSVRYVKRCGTAK